MKLLILSIFLAVSVMAQAAHYVTLSWIAPPPPQVSTYHWYRTVGACTLPQPWTKMSTTPISAVSVDDHAVLPGNYCYYVTAVAGGLESVPSGTAAALIPSYVPTGLQLSIVGSTVVATWIDGLNPSDVKYSLYLASGVCSGSPSFSRLATGIGGLTYTIASPPAGGSCIQVTATSGGIESMPSASQAVTMPTVAPTGLGLVVH